MRRLIRAAAHLAAWIPFLISAMDSWLSNWRVVGDGAMIALGSWTTFTRIPLVGQPTEFVGSPHDLGPAEYWLLAIPVRIDPARGVLWGAALLCMIAASLAIEAAWSVVGEAGGLLASAVILGLAAWMPGLAFRPYWNPYFGAMFFLATLAVTWAVMCGHRRWWPVLVIVASIAAQAHLMFALAAVTLTFIALMAALADAYVDRTGYRWAITGLIAGLACWMAPLDQQFTNRPGNMSLLLRAENAGHHAHLGLAFAMKTLAAFTEPPPLWSRLHLGQRQHIYRLLQTKPADFAVVMLVITAVIVIIAAFTFGSRRLGTLAAISLLVSVTAAITIAQMPQGHGDRGRLSYMIIVMYPAGLLIWVTLISTLVLVGRHLITGRHTMGRHRTVQHTTGQDLTRQYPTSQHLARLTASYGRVAAVPLIIIASLPGLIQQPGRPPAGPNADLVSAAIAQIQRSLPSDPAITLAVTSPKPDHYQVITGLFWALTSDGYRVNFTRSAPTPHVSVLVQGSKITVEVRRIARTIPQVPRDDTKPRDP